jgi:hypothetical protein
MRTTTPLILVLLATGACAARTPVAERTVVVQVAEPEPAAVTVVQVDQPKPRRSAGSRAFTAVVGAAVGTAAGAFLGWYTASLGCECSEYE